MGIQVVQLCSALATNSVANSTAIDLYAAAQIEAGPVFANIGAGNAMLIIHLDAGATPGAYDIAVATSSATGGTYTNIFAIDENTVGTIIITNVTVNNQWIRVEIEEATANAGTISAWLVSA